MVKGKEVIHILIAFYEHVNLVLLVLFPDFTQGGDACSSVHDLPWAWVLWLVTGSYTECKPVFPHLVLHFFCSYLKLLLWETTLVPAQCCAKVLRQKCCSPHSDILTKDGCSVPLCVARPHLMDADLLTLMRIIWNILMSALSIFCATCAMACLKKLSASVWWSSWHLLLPSS